MSDELSAALRQFATEQETAPVLTGAQVRGRAVRRARRRTAVTLGAATAVLALVALALVTDSAGDGKQRQIPAAPPTVPSPPPASAVPSVTAMPGPVTGTIDLGRGTLTVGDRVMPISMGFDRNPASKGPMTVYQKYVTKLLTVANAANGTRYKAEISYAVELRGPGNEPVYVGAARSYTVEGIDKSDTGTGWITLNQSDAKWFYEQAETAGVLSIGDTASASP